MDLLHYLMGLSMYVIAGLYFAGVIVFLMIGENYDEG
jgi:hypothetical protein